MPRETVLGGVPETPGEDDDRDLRPQTMRDMVGQREVRERLEIAVDAAQKRGEPLGHILFDGPPGLGKTTFAHCIPNEMGATKQMANGAGLTAPKDLLPYLTNLSEGSILFIDDREANLEPARARGWNVHLMQSAGPLRTAIEAFLKAPP